MGATAIGYRNGSILCNVVDNINDDEADEISLLTVSESLILERS